MPNSDVPIRRVVMFNSGVAFFEHRGEVEGEASLDLEFNVRDINDLLKSMVLQDLGGGRISTVSYSSKDPVTRTLQTFSIDLTANPTLAELLAQVRGEKIEIEGAVKVTGVILGVEYRQMRISEHETREVAHVNLLTDTGLRSLSLESVGSVKLLNPKLDAELRQALAVLAMSKSNEKKTVTLNFLGEGKRPVRVGYIQESPIWKTSYRLVLADDQPPLLQGWAIVENTTEADWDNVSLSLVSGRPISFIMDLYEPLYAVRPEVKPELYSSLRPRVYDQDLAAADAQFRRAGAEAAKAQSESRESLAARSRGALPGAPPAAAAGGGFGLGLLADGNAVREQALNLRQGFEAVAQAGDVGEMFQYNIATPVSLPRSRSAMLPIVNESVEGEKVSIYNQAVQAKHPLHGLKLRNTTDLHLMQGPVTVFDDGAYAGDAQIQALPPQSDRLISYALDLDTEVAPSQKQAPTQLVSVRIVKGVVQTQHKASRTNSFVVKNSSRKPKKVLIEYPLDTSWKLIKPAEPSEKTRDLYRFAVTAAPGEPLTLDVQEEQVRSESVALTNLPDNTIALYLNAQVVSDNVKQALREVVKRKLALAELARQRGELERQVTVIGQEQDRIRKNMEQLPKESDLFRRYVTKFTEQEDGIEELRKQITQLVALENQQRVDLDRYLANLNLD